MRKEAQRDARADKLLTQKESNWVPAVGDRLLLRPVTFSDVDVEPMRGKKKVQEKKAGKQIEGEVVGIYLRFILVEFETRGGKIRECFDRYGEFAPKEKDLVRRAKR